MAKLDPTVKKECAFITASVIVLSLVMQAGFVLLGKWDYTVLLGNLLGGLLAAGNFLGMGLTVQKAVTLEEKEAKELMRNSRALRSALQLLGAVLGICLPFISAVALILPLFFPRIALNFRPLFDKKGGDKNE